MNKISCSGYCGKCGREHFLSEGAAYRYCLELIRTLEREKRIDFDVSPERCDPGFSTDYLFGNALGQMFGILVCNDRYGREVVFKAFSGQYNGVWNIKGWVPPLLDAEEFHRISFDADKEIKSLGRQIDLLPGDSEERPGLIRHRKELSQNLMKEIHSLYRLRNFNGDEVSLFRAFPEDRGMPTGTGDCCAPKLLNYAAGKSLMPLGLAEFYFGRTNRSKTKRHKEFYPACENKCRPILGFLLCGAEST